MTIATLDSRSVGSKIWNNKDEYLDDVSIITEIILEAQNFEKMNDIGEMYLNWV